MIPEQQVHASAGIQRLFFKAHDQVHYLSGLGSAIQNVARKYEMRRAAVPAKPFVKYAGIFQRRCHRIIGAMHIADCNDPFYARPAPFFGQRLCLA